MKISEPVVVVSGVAHGWRSCLSKWTQIFYPFNIDRILHKAWVEVQDMRIQNMYGHRQAVGGRNHATGKLIQQYVLPGRWL